MLTQVATRSKNEVGRPLTTLVELIKKAVARSAEEIGELLVEARPQFSAAAEFYSWTNRNFGFRQSQANEYLRLGKYRESSTGAQHFSSLREFNRQTTDRPSAAGTGKVSWQQPVQQILGRVDLDTLRDAELKRAEERDAERRLGLQLIDIGYKALATKLHPDKGGSRNAMARLNQVRDRLKASV